MEMSNITSAVVAVCIVLGGLLFFDLLYETTPEKSPSLVRYETCMTIGMTIYTGGSYNGMPLKARCWQGTFLR